MKSSRRKQADQDEDYEISFMDANDLRKNNIVLLRGKEPCKVLEYHKSAPGTSRFFIHSVLSAVSKTPEFVHRRYQAFNSYSSLISQGKHGSAKIRMVGLHLFTLKKVEDIFGSSEQVSLPKASKTEYELMDISEEGYVACQLSDTRW